MSEILLARPRPAAETYIVQILYAGCCGIDVHKDSVTACVSIYTNSPEPEVRKKELPRL